MKNYLLLAMTLTALVGSASHLGAISESTTYQWTVWFADNGKFYKNVFNALNKKFSVSQKPFIVNGKNVDWKGKQWNAKESTEAIYSIDTNHLRATLPNGQADVNIPAAKDYPIKSLIVFDHYAYIFSLKKLYIIDLTKIETRKPKTIVIPINTIKFPNYSESKYEYVYPADRGEEDITSTTIRIQQKAWPRSVENVDVLDFDEMVYNPTDRSVTFVDEYWGESSDGATEFKRITRNIAPKTLELRLRHATVIKLNITNPLQPTLIKD